MAGTLKNFYETLGVPRSATDEQIKTAYRKLILKFHPDKNVGDTYFEDWSKKIIEAFEVLSDPQLRAEYDQVYDEHKRAAKRTFQETATPPPPEPASTASAAEPEPAKEPFRPEAEEEPSENAPAFEEAAAEPAPIVEETTDQDAEMAAIKEQVPAYITAKQEYLRAEKNFKTIKQQKPAAASQKNNWPLIALCLLLIAGSVVWMIKAPPAKDKIATGPDGAVTLASKVMIVSAPKAFFYEDPQKLIKTNKYVTAGNKVSVSKKYKNYYYAVFHSIADPNYQVAGWINAADLQQ
ncbi:hypothetical protein A8C56_16680 [Niabella ginsenosidivorans]|uniref:J domain-containing protein n=1 Tax=Niabella ginsenosidivorans TaxID=1176587 RepID=A0A1A9I6U7_9BACT|nr:DnaJ domain-containing protein [Niabella ginsenosidivorans]ANH82382.1 hypothetical protein A8C56_16680 [Niabella ginsenosidivorans]